MQANFSDDELIAYLLGDADPKRRLELETCLSSDPELLFRLQQLRGVLGHLDSLSGMYEPPADLVSNTLERIESAEKVQLSQAVPAEGFDEVSNHHNRIDSLVLGLSLALICCMILPAVVTARFVARKNQCAHNMADTGNQLVAFSMSDPNGRFPYVGDDPYTSFAGIFPVHLTDRGYSVDIRQLHCPSVSPVNYDTPVACKNIPSLAQLRELSPAELADLQHFLGGNYAYNVGVLDETGVRVAPKCEGRSNFAILADAPNFVKQGEQFLAHDGRGINILYEDGHVAFLCLPDSDQLPTDLHDHPFRNMDGVHAPGLHNSDSVLAPSSFSPLQEFISSSPSKDWD